MSDKWQEEYRKLSEFVAANPQVKITKSSVSIPEDAKAEFWKLFDETRRAFIKERFPSLISDAEILSRNYMQAAKDVKNLLGLDDISTTPGRNRFLCDPKDMLIRILHDNLFDLLKGKTDINAFEQKASGNLEVFFKDVYQHAYSQWVALSLVQLLQADKGLGAPRINLNYKAIMRKMRNTAQTDLPQEANKAPLQTAETPRLKQLSKIEFAPQGMSDFTVPDFIIHSPRLNRYVAVKMEFTVSMHIAANASDHREWYPIETAALLGRDTILVYIADEPGDIALVADSKKVCRPDLILECRGLRKWYEKDGGKQIIRNFEALKPNLGTYVISRDTVPELVSKELASTPVIEAAIPKENSVCPAVAEPEAETPVQQAGIHIVINDLDQSMLQPVMDTFMQLKREMEPPATDSQEASGTGNILKRIYNAIFRKSSAKMINN